MGSDWTGFIFSGRGVILAFYLIGQVKNEISSLEISRHLGVKYDTA